MVTWIISRGAKREHHEKARNKVFHNTAFKETIISTLLKILNHKGNIDKKKFRTEKYLLLLTLSLFKLSVQLSVLF